MFCPQCGAPNEEDATYCGNCGAVMGAEETPDEELNLGLDEPVVELAPARIPLAEDNLPAVPPPPPAPAPLPPPPARAYAAASTVTTSGLAIASLVLGIGGLTLLPLIGSIAAIILGYMARNEIRSRPGEVEGDGLALAGIIMGWIAVGISILGILAGAGLMVCGVCASVGAGG